LKGCRKKLANDRENSIVKSLRIAAMLLLVAGPGYAQSLGTNIIPDTPSKTPEQLEREQAIERDYKETLKKIPDGKASSDPWSNVRGAEKQPGSAKSSAPTKNTQAKNNQARPVATPQ
jgi:hypothetical protein